MRLVNKILSTPHGALGTSAFVFEFRVFGFLLSTPHGALGTRMQKDAEEPILVSFNSTRCIRNMQTQRPPEFLCPFWLSTPHGALGT